MPSAGKCWYHIILNARGSWLPGDPRGFRSRGHKQHSSGDYKHPPPKSEHAGLHRHAQTISRPPIFFTPAARPLIGRAIRDKIDKQTHRMLAICVGSNHAHLLVELPNCRAMVNKIVGTWKQAASHRTRAILPGKIWASGGDPIPVRDKAHQRRVFEYIQRHRHEGAWVWSFREGEG